MSNTVYIKQPNGSYKKVSYIEKELNGKLHLTEDLLPIGATGAEGKMGLRGSNGLNGQDGISGRDGKDGLDGKNGIHGLDGYTPIKGVDYFDGLQGEIGPQGEIGIQGPQGEIGLQGEVGPQGPQGPQGLQGLKGDVGPQGPQGIPGLPGLTGDRGELGPRGFVGPQGIQGATGATGPRGLPGKDGRNGGMGPMGAPGPAGADGATGSLPADFSQAKAGYVIGASFSGTTLYYDVVFDTVYDNVDYSVVITGADVRTWSVSNKLVSGFRIESNSVVTLPGNVYWISTLGEGALRGEVGPTGPTGSYSGYTFGMLSGTFSASSMISGPPLYYDVVFTSAFTASYLVNIESDSPRDWTITNKTSNGFRVDSNSTSTLDEVILWQATEMKTGNVGVVVNTYGPFNYTYRTTDYNITGSDYTINASGSVTTYLPTPTDTGKVYVIKNSGGGIVNVTGTGSEYIDGDLVLNLTEFESVTVQSTGSGWIII